MQITLYGGVGEIGGNIIELQAGGNRILFDFGKSFSAGEEFFFDPYLQPRPSAGLLDYFEFGLLPGIPGLYRAQDLRLTEISPCPARFDGVFLSHAHGDHSYNLRYLDPEIPLHLGSTTQEILQIWEDTGRVFKLGEHTRLETFRTNQAIRIGPDLEVWPVHVDHSIPGAYGFVAVTGEGPLVYSGDLRFHGPASRLSQEFVRIAAMAHPKVLLLEGTRINSDRRDSEEDVFYRSVDLVRKTGGLVVVVQSPRDFDRIRTFWRVARETGRKLVVPLRTACLLEGLSDDPHLPDAEELWADQEHLRVHFHRAGSGAYSEQDYARTFPCRTKRRLSGTERPCRPRKLEAAEIGRRQEEFIWVLDFWHFTELMEARPREGSLLIYSMSEFLEDPIDILKDEILQNWCTRYHLHKEQVHASGHASGPELRRLVEEIGPEVLIPIHTEHPELFAGWGPRLLIPEKGKPILIG